MSRNTIPPRNALRLGDDRMEARLYDALRDDLRDERLVTLALQALLDELRDGGDDGTWTPTQIRCVLAEVLL